MARMHACNSVVPISAGTATADIASGEEDKKEEDGDADAGIRVLTPDKAAAKAAGTLKAAPASASKAIVQQQQHQQQKRARGDESAGFEEVPLGADGAGSRGADSSGDSDSDSDAGLAKMDDHSRAEVCNCYPLLSPQLP
jgi:hypothetical protein